MKAVNGAAHVQKFASNTLPPEVVAGLDKVLRNGALASNMQTSRKWSPQRVMERQNTDDTQRALSKTQIVAPTRQEPPKASVPEADPEPAESYTGQPSVMDAQLQGDLPNLLSDPPLENPFQTLLQKQSS